MQSFEQSHGDIRLRQYSLIRFPEMSFLGRALGQFLNRWMTDKVANSSAMRQTAKVAVKGVKSIQGGAKVVCESLLYQK